MKDGRARGIGIGLLCLGITMLFAGIVLTVTIGTILSPVILSGSILVNSAGVVLLRGLRKPEGRDK